ncbi:MAG TPA: hypothetical protein VFO34_07475 [Candidatus Acidoferrales bacterium]|nr:hypothetical protein [Candidatus Acidoferrales bacterium]
MTHSELDKYRVGVPIAICGVCVLPWFLIGSNSVEHSKTAYELVAPAIGALMAFLYLGCDVRDFIWGGEVRNYVGKQIEDALLGLIPADLALSKGERDKLKVEVFKKLTGVFWEAVDSDEMLRAQKEHFYSNGLFYTSSIDVFFICTFAGLLYVVATLLTSNSAYLLPAVVLVLIGLFSNFFVKPVFRHKHLALSNEQLELLNRRQGNFVTQRFREIIEDWRTQA